MQSAFGTEAQDDPMTDSQGLRVGVVSRAVARMLRYQRQSVLLRDLSALPEEVIYILLFMRRDVRAPTEDVARRSEEHTSELQSLMRISYAVFCLKKNKRQHIPNRSPVV